LLLLLRAGAARFRRRGRRRRHTAAETPTTGASRPETTPVPSAYLNPRPMSTGLSFLAGGLRRRHRAWRAVRGCLFLFNLHTLLLCLVTCAFTKLCASRGWTYDIDSQQFVMAVPFPLTFALTQSFTRRERVLTFIAELKASCIAVFFAFRDWPQVFPAGGGGGGGRVAAVAAAAAAAAAAAGEAKADGVGGEGAGAGLAGATRGGGPRWPATLGDNTHPWACEARGVILDFLSAVRDYLGAASGYESVGEARLLEHGNYFRDLIFGGATRGGGSRGRRGRPAPLLAPTASLVQRVRASVHQQPGHEPLMRVYSALSRLHVLNEHLSQAARYGRGAEGSSSRTAQYIRFMAAQFEQIRTVKDYRTPSMLRSCCAVLVHLGCFALAPYFVFRGNCTNWGTGPPGVDPSTGDGMCAAPYVNAVMYVVVSMLLLNVQASSEHPFDAEGVDDIFVEIGDEVWEVSTMVGPTGPVSLDGAHPFVGGAGGGWAGGDVLFGPTTDAAREVEAAMLRRAARRSGVQ
jgi:hypothetical protein